MRIAAHRGTRIHAPENSIAALLSAYAAGADVLEFDLQMTADGHLVLSHDGTTDRLTGDGGDITQLTLHELRDTAGKFDFSRSFNPFAVDGFQYFRTKRRLQIETFERVLDLVPDDVELLIELKRDSSKTPDRREAFVSAALAALRSRGRIDAAVVYSKDPESVALAKRREPTLRTAAFDWERSPEDQIALVREVGADGLVTDVGSVLEGGRLTGFGERLAALHREGLRVGAVLYPFRDPGVFTATEYHALSSQPFVWSLSTDTLLAADVEGERVDVAALCGRDWTWFESDFAGTRTDRHWVALGYAKANEYAAVRQEDGIHVQIAPYDGWLPSPPTGDPVQDKLAELELRLLYAERDWPFYSGGGLGIVRGIDGDFSAEVDYRIARPLTQAQTLEMAVVNVDPGSHQELPPTSFRGKDSFYDPHGAPPFVGVEHDEDDGYRINWNLGAEYDNNQYGPPVGDGKSPQSGVLRLDRHGEVFAAYYKNAVEAPDWICVGVTRNASLNRTVYLRCVAKRWRQEDPADPTKFFPIEHNTFTFARLTVRRRPDQGRQ